MRFLELKLTHFGKFNNGHISLKDGINLIYGENEAGKSTIHTFIRGMLFGIEKGRGRASKDDIYGKYQPWDTPGAYSGSMDIEVKGRKLRIYRSFDKNNKETIITDLSTGRELSEFSDNMQELLEGLTQAGYLNTISIEQLKAKTGQDLADEVRNYITNLSLSKSNEVDVAKALGFLHTKRKELEHNLPGDEIQKIREAIQEGLEKEARMDELTEKLRTINTQDQAYSNSLYNLQSIECPTGFADVTEYESYLNKLPVYEEKMRSYENVLKQLEQIDKRLENWKGEIDSNNRENSKNIANNIANNIEELAQGRLTITELITKKDNIVFKEQEEISGSNVKKMVSAVMVVVSILILLYSFKGNVLMSLAGMAMLTAGVAFYLVTNLKRKRDKEQLHKTLLDIQGNIENIEKKSRNILLTYHCKDESELKKKYEELLKNELEIYHKKNMITEQEYEKSPLRDQLLGVEKEIIHYVNRFKGFIKENGIEGAINSVSSQLMFHLKTYIIRESKQLKESMNLVVKQQEEFALKKERIKWELKALDGYEDELLANQELLLRLIEKEENIKKELEAINLAVLTINRLSVDIHDSFGRELNKIVSDLTKETTAGKYTDIKVDEKMDIKILTGHQYVTIDKLSLGTIDQLYFAIRVAVSDLIYGKNVMPLLFDDSFALYDDKRTQSVLSYLSENKGQVLIFTCHNREKEIMDSNHIRYNYIDLGNN